MSFIKTGGSKVEAAKRFAVARKTVCNYLTLVQSGALAPKESWGSWKRFAPAKVRGETVITKPRFRDLLKHSNDNS